MNAELVGYRQLAASESRAKAEALSAFRTAEQKLQRRDDTASSLLKELEQKHAGLVFEQKSASLLHDAVNPNEENPQVYPQRREEAARGVHRVPGTREKGQRGTRGEQRITTSTMRIRK